MHTLTSNLPSTLRFATSTPLFYRMLGATLAYPSWFNYRSVGVGGRCGWIRPQHFNSCARHLFEIATLLSTNALQRGRVILTGNEYPIKNPETENEYPKRVTYIKSVIESKRDVRNLDELLPRRLALANHCTSLRIDIMSGCESILR